MQQIGVAVHHALDAGKVLGRLPLDHIGRQCPRAAGEANQRHPAIQLATDNPYRIGHVAQFLLRIRHPQCIDRCAITHRLAEPRPLALGKVQPQPHRIRDGEDVREQNGGIQWISIQRLQSDLAGQLRGLAQRQEVAGLGAAGTVLGQITTGLTHHPHRRHVHRLPHQGTQKSIVF